MAFDKRLLDVVACPICKGKLDYSKDENVLVCRFDRVAYPINEGIPVLIEEEALQLSTEELEAYQ